MHEAARSLGARVTALDPEFGVLQEFELAGVRRIVVGNRVPLNGAGASALARDKHYSGLVLARAGLRVPESARCYSPHGRRTSNFKSLTGPAPAITLAEARGFPLVIKPNSASMSRGAAVVANSTQVQPALDEAWIHDEVALAQPVIPGRDLRVDILDGRFLIAYERVPIAVQGDGRTPLRALLAAQDARADRDEVWARWQQADIWRQRVGARGPEWVPAAGEALSFATPICNLNALTSGRLVSELPTSLLDLVRAAGEAVGLRHFGVDLKLPAFDAVPDDITIIEINSWPLFSQVYRMGYREQAIAAQRAVLRAAFTTTPQGRPVDSNATTERALAENSPQR